MSAQVTLVTIIITTPLIIIAIIIIMIIIISGIIMIFLCTARVTDDSLLVLIANALPHWLLQGTKVDHLFVKNHHQHHHSHSPPSPSASSSSWPSSSSSGVEEILLCASRRAESQQWTALESCFCKNEGQRLLFLWVFKDDNSWSYWW